VYTGKLYDTILGKIRVPIELCNGQGLGILHHDFYIIEHSPVDVLLGMDFMPSQGFGGCSLSSPLGFHFIKATPKDIFSC